LPRTEYSLFEKLRNSFKDEQTYDEIMKCFYCYVEGVFNQYEFFLLVEPYFDRSNDELLTSLRQMVASRDNTRRHHNLLCKPFSEFDTSNFKKVSYSYYEMPQEFPRPICKGREREDYKVLCKEIFNDDYSSLPQGSENFKFKTKNQYEDVLFRTEDEMYKADHEIGNIFSTMKTLEEEKLRIDSLNAADKEHY
jgi:histone deacetylase complex regulatory component SIN3